MVLTILRATGVVTLIAEDKVGGICRQYYQKSVVLPTKTLKAPAASKYSDPDAAFACIGNLELFDPAAVGTSKWPPDPGEVRNSKRPLHPGAVGTSEWPPDPGAVGTFEWDPDPGGCLGA
jgi:hypothetical protein